MKNPNDLPRILFRLYVTPFYRPKAVSAGYRKDVRIKRDDLCGVALVDNKVRKPEILLADACDRDWTR